MEPTNEQIKSWFIEMITHCDGIAIVRWNEVERFLEECEPFPNLRSLFKHNLPNPLNFPEETK